MYCTGLNSKGNPCGNTVAHGKYCAWHIPDAKVDKRTKPVSKKTPANKPVSKKKTQANKPVSKKKTQGSKPVSKNIQQQAQEIQQMVYMDKGRNPSQYAIVNEVTVAVYRTLFTTK